MIHGVIEASTSMGLTVGLVTCRRVDAGEQNPTNLLWPVFIGDVEGAREILRRNRAAVLDIAHEDGRSSLHIATSWPPNWNKALSLIQCVMAAGADPDLADDYNQTPRQSIASMFLHHDIPPDVRAALEQLFPPQTWIESLRLTFLQEIVLGFSPVNLESVLQSRDPAVQAQVNQRDALGMTPRMHALKKGNLDHVRALVAAGADVNLASQDRITPMYRDIWPRLGLSNPDVISMLVGHGPRINSTDPKKGAGILYQAAGMNESLLPERLLSAGVDVHSVTRYGDTAMHSAAIHNASASIKVLYDNGANLNALNNWDQTPLMDGISRNAHEAQSTLLELNADVLILDKNGFSFLNIAAICGDVGTYNTLASFRLEVTAWQDVSYKIQTARDRFGDRNDSNHQELRDAFEHLLGLLRTGLDDNHDGDEGGGGSWNECNNNDSDEEEAFVDAVEYL
jgi:ankyrin repeat protein